MPVTFSVEPRGGGHATLAPTVPVLTGDDGRASATFTAGSVITEYVVTATADLGGGRQVTGTVTVKTEGQLKRTIAQLHQVIGDFRTGRRRLGVLGGSQGCAGAKAKMEPGAPDPVLPAPS